jgi:hypothetical protein
MVKITDFFAWKRKRERQYSPSVLITLGEEYDLRTAFNEAKSLKDPYRAPHSTFRALDQSNHFQAVQFLAQFGPLELEGGESFWVDLDEFWTKRARFTGAAKLWENRDNGLKLREVLKDLRIHLSEIDEADQIEFAPMRVNWGVVGLRQNSPKPEDFSREENASSGFLHPLRAPSDFFEDWIQRVPTGFLRQYALTLLNRELNVQMTGRSIYWQLMQIGSHEGFRPAIAADSLWKTLWEFLGLETADERMWRICPHCMKLFCPKRSDQFYCSSRQQVLASKRENARSRRERKRLRRMGGN